MNLKTSQDWTILDSCKTDFKEFADYGLRSEVYAAFNIEEDVLSLRVHGTVVKLKVFSQ